MRRSLATRLLCLPLIVGLSVPGLGGVEVVAAGTITPIQHVVVIFQENVSFDHYFGTYPDAENPPNEPRFVPKADTPTVNGLTGALLTNNINKVNPFRLGRAQAATCDQNHDYKDEQVAYHAGGLDLFVETLGNGTSPCKATDVMGYFDGNTVTALWNYAQHFAMSDNHFDTVFGPSTPGALNLISGQTHGASDPTPAADHEVVEGTVVGDPQPLGDKCSTRDAVEMAATNRNVGDLLNAKNVTWGFFQGGFRDCNAFHIGSDGKKKNDYIPHHQPFQYYASTRNLDHLPPTSVDMIGQTDQANHQYDLTDFWDAVNAGHLPAVSFLKAAGYQDGHAGYSDPLAEQTFLVETINKLQALPEWKTMAIFIAYDDSDGWYDHVMPPIVSPSASAEDALTGPGLCVKSNPTGIQGRCGYGPRLPLLVISPFARVNFVDHTLSDQSSILQFIEDNWELGRIGGGSFDELAGTLFNMFDFRHGHRAAQLILDPTTGHPLPKVASDSSTGDSAQGN